MRALASWALGILAAQAALYGCASATTSGWPQGIGDLEPSLSASVAPARLPHNVRIVSPPDTVDPSRAAWSGTWTGWAGQTKQAETRLAVESVSNEGAQIVYSFISPQVSGGYVTRLSATFIGNELQGALNNGQAKVFYRMRSPTVIEFMFQQGGALSYGILTKDEQKR